MHGSRVWLAIALIGLGQTLALAEARPDGLWLTPSELESTLKDKELIGEYASGRSFSETYRADGGLRYRDDSRESGGHWSISSGTFCTIYDDDPAGGCFRVQRSGDNCFEFYFVARTEDKAPGLDTREPDWTARAWLADRASTCKERMGV